MSAVKINYLNGLFLINKPKGITSHDVVARVRKSLQMKSVGHVGTLDPMATGLMGILVGEATKVSDYLRDETKSYKLQLKLGIETDSFDITGNIIAEADTGHLSREDVLSRINSFQGEVELRVPAFSAIKRDGKKLYQRARDGEEFTPPLKLMKFYNLKIESCELPYVDLSFDCTKGSYVRSWISELGKKLSVGATMTRLERTRILNYHLGESITLDELDKFSPQFSKLKLSFQNTQNNELTTEVTTAPSKGAYQDLYRDLGLSYYDLSRLLPLWKSITINGRDERMMLNGVITHGLNRRLILEQKLAQKLNSSQGVKVISSQTGQLLSLLEALPDSPLKIRRVFRL